MQAKWVNSKYENKTIENISIWKMKNFNVRDIIPGLSMTNIQIVKY